jgi:hypothetical protein
LAQASAHFAAIARETTEGPAQVVYAPASSPASARWDGEAIADAAILLILELLWRIPKAGKTDGWAIWLDAAARLGYAVSGLGLWHAILDGRHSMLLLHRAGSAARSSGLVAPPDWQELTYFIFRFFGGDHPFVPWRPYDWWWLRPHSPLTDPMDDLSSWPMPRALAVSKVLTVRDHLSAIASKPDLLQSLPPRATAIALFASAHILRRPSPAGLFLADDGQVVAARNDLLRRAASWLVQQFPKYAYRPELEKMIAAVGVENTGGETDGGFAAA